MSPLALSLHFLQALPDNRLVALAREGHPPAFEALVRRYRKELLAYCRRLHPHSVGAEDALQQTLLQAWTALNGGADIRDVRPWLYRIAHNVTVNQLRARISVAQDLSEAADGREVHQLVEQRLQALAALAGMAALPALQREVFIRTTLDGASHEEVASSLGLSNGAVRGLIYRARATLRSAAAALTPSPALHWAIRRAETRAGAARGVSELLAGGGGAGVATAIAKVGAVLTLAGAVAGTGGAIVSHWSSHHDPARSAAHSTSAQAHSPAAGVNRVVDELARIEPGSGPESRGHRHLGQVASRATDERRNFTSLHEDHGGSGGASSGGNDGRSQGGSNGGSSISTNASSDGGPAPTATIASSSDGGSSGGSGGSDGSSSGSGSTSTSTTSGSGGGTSGGGGSSGQQVSTVATASGGSSGSDGRSSSGSSGSSDTMTTAH